MVLKPTFTAMLSVCSGSTCSGQNFLPWGVATWLFPKGHNKKCDQCVQCDRPIPGAEGQGMGGLITPESAISRE